jgi:hypothetical protein
MQIPKKALKEFKALYKKKFNKELSDQETLEQATSLITLVKAIYRPIPKESKDKLKTDN